MGDHWGNRHLLAQALEALEWCSGSSDFQPKGKARKGWLLLCQPVLEAAGLAVPRKKPPFGTAVSKRAKLNG